MPAALCESYNELQVQVAKVKGIHSGIIRIATFPSVAGTWLPNTIRAFSREYPLVDFEILMGDYEEIAQMLRDGRINCAIMSWPFNGEAPFDFTFIQNDNYVVLLSEESPLIKYDKIPLHILANEPMIMLEKDGLTEEISLFFEQNGIIPNVKFRAWDNNAIMCMVESGLGHKHALTAYDRALRIPNRHQRTGSSRIPAHRLLREGLPQNARARKDISCIYKRYKGAALIQGRKK